MHQEVIKRDYKLNDTVWILLPSSGINGPFVRTKAQIVHSFTVDHHVNEYFVCEVDIDQYPKLEIRDCTTMSATQDGFISFDNRDRII